MLAHAPQYPLQKPAAMHLDFLVLGVCTLICGFLGVPPGSGLLPQAPWHTRSLATRRVDVVVEAGDA